jgi:hypothetical protein
MLDSIIFLFLRKTSAHRIITILNFVLVIDLNPTIDYAPIVS